MTKKILMTGITGLIGRWTAAALTRDGAVVVATMRNAEARASELLTWIAAHGGNAERVVLVDGNLADEGFLSKSPLCDHLKDISHVYSFAGAMAWGLDPNYAKRVNATAVSELLEWAKCQKSLERFVHISGYLLTSPRHREAIGFDPIVLASGNVKRSFRRLYKRVGAYEASKIEADFLVRRAALEGLPTTILNPATVIGSAETGEIHQVFGIEGLIDGLKHGTLSAVPGTPQDWTPLVSIDYVAEFAARVPMEETERSSDYVLLNQGTPPLKEMIAIIAGELGVKEPKRHVPVWALRAVLKSGLEKRLGTPAEALAFINDYRYDTRSAEAAASQSRIAQPEIREALRKTLRYVEAQQTSEEAA